MTEQRPAWAAGAVDRGFVETVTRVLYERFGLNVASMLPLEGEADATFEVKLADGTRVVAKVSSPDASRDVVEWQQSLLRAVEAAGNAPSVPRVISTTDGSDLALDSRDGASYIVRVQSWLEGIPLGTLDRHSPRLLYEIGESAAKLSIGLDGASVPPRETTHHWDVMRSPEAISEVISAVSTKEQRILVERIVRWFYESVDPLRVLLPRSVVHQDLNDANILVAPDDDGYHHVSGILDFGDALFSARVTELAVATAYSMLRKADPLVAAGAVVRGFHDTRPLSDSEIGVVYPMAAARLCVNALTWSLRDQRGGNPYGRRRSQHAWPTIAKLGQIPPELAEAYLHEQLSDGAYETQESLKYLVSWSGVSVSARGIGIALEDVDLSVGSTDPDVGVTDSVSGMAGLAGRHMTSRMGRLARRMTEVGEPATILLGVDVYCFGEASIESPIDGVIEPPVAPLRESDSENAVLLRHRVGTQGTFWSKWTGLNRSPNPGEAIGQGRPFASAPASEKGDPSFTVAIFTSLDAACLAPTFVPSHLVNAWRTISPDPSTLLNVERIPAGTSSRDVGWVSNVRDSHLARSQRSYYSRPMNLVKSDGVWMYDENGLGYLDAINNVTHVGHANPRVVAAANRQMRRLNTNSRFTYDVMASYLERLTQLLPPQLEVAFFVCTGSEANDLALRMARQVTGRTDVLVIDGAYHGNTASVMEISPNRYKGRGGAGRPPTTHEVTQPNLYRGTYGYGDPGAGAKYAAEVASHVHRLVEDGRPPAAFFAESLMGTAGCIKFPDGYLGPAFDAVRSAGGLCVSDEVQVGFGRLGDKFWGFERQDVVPDIVTMGKPMGNGHPMAAVLTTREVADSFDNGVKFFNTFGGNPVSCAIGLAVLDEIEENRLQANAADNGSLLLESLVGLGEKHELIGDVRGQGLYLGIELVRNRATKEPATREALYVSERMKDEGVIVYPTGTFDNILKLKPPMVFGSEHVEIFVGALDSVLSQAW